MKCPTCGAENDAANRFCDQCGSRLEASGAPSAAQAALASQPTAAAATCPSCGATVVPGEAFCDECGAALSGVVASAGASSDAPTMFAPPPSAATATSGAATAGGPANADQGLTCPACGHQNMAGDRFCDNCGASLVAASAPATIVAPAQGSAGPSDEDLLRALNATPPSATTSTPPPDQAPPADGPLQSPDPLQEPPSQTPQPQEAPPSQTPQPQEAPPSETPQPQKVDADMVTAEQTPAPPQADYQRERQRLEDEIARQQQIIAQFEQMQTTFGAATPAVVTQGLAEARDALARAQASFDGLKPPTPAIDPAEVARLNDEIARQQQIIAQFEQMQTTFGAATPAVVTQGLAEARDAKARAESALAALGGGAPATSAAPSDVQASMARTEVDLGALGTVPAPSATVPAGPPESAPVQSAPAEVAAPVMPAPTPVAVPRLVIDASGQEMPLPTDKSEIIIGREDPISGIFPEIDLTTHGGESGGVSRQHARINRDGGQWTITDLNSTNYTRVDGTKIEPSVPVPIKNGARLQLGRVAMTFME